MQCELCKTKTATVHLTEIVNGQRTESHLCQSCAQKEGVTVKSQLSLNELLSSLIAAHQNTDEANQSTSAANCPVCGMTMEMFSKHALLGCPKDYEVFGDNLQQIIQKAHDGNSTHKGKVPAGVDQKELKSVSEAEDIKKQLDRAVQQENYELAAKLRDQLKTLQ